MSGPGPGMPGPPGFFGYVEWISFRRDHAAIHASAMPQSLAGSSVAICR